MSALSGERVMPATVWPAETSSGTTRTPTRPLAPATKIRMGNDRSSRASAARAGAAVGAMTSFWDLGILVAGPVSGLVAAGPGTQARPGPAGPGFRVAFWIAAAMPLVALAVTGPRIRGLRG